IVAILLTRQTNKKMTKWVRSGTRYVVTTRNPKTTVYSKADRTSTVAGTFEEAGKEITTRFSTPGLKGDGIYWQVSHFEKEDDWSTFLSGFIPEVDLKFE